MRNAHSLASDSFTLSMGQELVYPLLTASSAAPVWCCTEHFHGSGSALCKARRRSFSFRLFLFRRHRYYRKFMMLAQKRTCGGFESSKPPHKELFCAWKIGLPSSGFFLYCRWADISMYYADCTFFSKESPLKKMIAAPLPSNSRT